MVVGKVIQFPNNLFYQFKGKSVKQCYASILSMKTEDLVRLLYNFDNNPDSRFTEELMIACAFFMKKKLEVSI